jgi:hypothetical protein
LGRSENGLGRSENGLGDAIRENGCGPFHWKQGSYAI